MPKGLLIAHGEVWRRARQTLSPTFSANKMKMVSLSACRIAIRNVTVGTSHLKYCVSS